MRGHDVLYKLRLLYHNIPYWVRGAPDGLPIPPRRLRTLTWPPAVDLSLYFGDGGATAERMLDNLAQYGVNPEDIGALLDFGCGNGHVVRQFYALKHKMRQAKFYGADINPEQITWCQAHLPFAKFNVNQASPPLPYADKQFDFIYNFSVFTHLSEPQRFEWMSELTRLLHPGGYLLLTTCGECYVEGLKDKERAEFRAGRLVVRHPEVAGIPAAYIVCHAVHPVSYVKEK